MAKKEDDWYIKAHSLVQGQKTDEGAVTQTLWFLPRIQRTLSAMAIKQPLPLND